MSYVALVTAGIPPPSRWPAVLAPAGFRRPAGPAAPRCPRSPAAWYDRAALQAPGVALFWGKACFFCQLLHRQGDVGTAQGPAGPGNKQGARGDSLVACVLQQFLRQSPWQGERSPFTRHRRDFSGLHGLHGHGVHAVYRKPRAGDHLAKQIGFGFSQRSGRPQQPQVLSSGERGLQVRVHGGQVLHLVLPQPQMREHPVYRRQPVLDRVGLVALLQKVIPPALGGPRLQSALWQRFVERLQVPPVRAKRLGSAAFAAQLLQVLFHLFPAEVRAFLGPIRYRSPPVPPGNNLNRLSLQVGVERQQCSQCLWILYHGVVKKTSTSSILNAKK